MTIVCMVMLSNVVASTSYSAVRFKTATKNAHCNWTPTPCSDAQCPLPDAPSDGIINAGDSMTLPASIKVPAITATFGTDGILVFNSTIDLDITQLILPVVETKCYLIGFGGKDSRHCPFLPSPSTLFPLLFSVCKSSSTGQQSTITA